MPIGKNALKRVNNGYSNVSTAAPDMENSEIAVTENKKLDEKVAEKKTTPKKTEPKKSEPKEKKGKSVSTEQKVLNESSHPDGFIRISFGDDMPVYLL